ncbi:hypothetical protein ACFFP0_16605 [Rhizobium puerariae]|uniref:Avidin family protein n=1 Tax=Rhizobium puerariae TaxID=1585791 RepID=A0ABV6AIN8_9HYPH
MAVLPRSFGGYRAWLAADARAVARSLTTSVIRDYDPRAGNLAGRIWGIIMKKFLAFALLGAAVGWPAQAQTVNAGTYDVEGTNLDGSKYGGTATITLTSETTCVIEWKTGNSKKATSSGICMLYDNAFSAAYVMGKAVGLVVYEVKDDGSLEGAWTISGQDGSGTETLTPQ